MTDTARDRLEAALSLMREVSVDPGLGFLKPTADAAAALIAERDTLADENRRIRASIADWTRRWSAAVLRAERAEAKVAAVEALREQARGHADWGWRKVVTVDQIRAALADPTPTRVVVNENVPRNIAGIVGDFSALTDPDPTPGGEQP